MVAIIESKAVKVIRVEVIPEAWAFVQGFIVPA